jgi:hypothetical protein
MLETEHRDFDMDDRTEWPVLEGITPADKREHNISING